MLQLLLEIEKELVLILIEVGRSSGIGILNAILAPAPLECNPRTPLGRPRRDSLVALGTAIGVVFTPRCCHVGW
jgi:hypothetical protein